MCDIPWPQYSATSLARAAMVSSSRQVGETGPDAPVSVAAVSTRAPGAAADAGGRTRVTERAARSGCRPGADDGFFRSSSAAYAAYHPTLLAEPWSGLPNR